MAVLPIINGRWILFHSGGALSGAGGGGLGGAPLPFKVGGFGTDVSPRSTRWISETGHFLWAARLRSVVEMVDAELMCWEERQLGEAAGHYPRAAEMGYPVEMLLEEVLRQIEHGFMTLPGSSTTRYGSFSACLLLSNPWCYSTSSHRITRLPLIRLNGHIPCVHELLIWLVPLCLLSSTCVLNSVLKNQLVNRARSSLLTREQRFQ